MSVRFFLVSLTIGFTLTSLAATDWPQWRGVERAGISRETGLLKKWPADGPPLRWKASDIGTGYSSPAIVQGKLFVQTTMGDQEAALCLDEKTGKQLWSTNFGKVGKNQGPPYPGTRSTPTFNGDRLFCLASDGELACLDAQTGSIKWQKHLRQDFAGKPGMWVYSESLLIDGDAMICTPGGTKSPLVALQKSTGEVIWQATGVPDMGTAEYSSIMVVQEGGRKQYVQFLRKGLVGIDAQTGKFLWRYDKTIDQGANILTPIVQGNRIFSSGSRSGGGLIQIKQAGDQFQAEELYFNKALGSSIGGAVLIDGHLYGSTSQALYCADFATGQVKWTNRSVGAASLCYADGCIYARGYNTGEVALVKATPKAYQELCRFKQPDRSKIQAWPHPVIANGGLYLRDQEVLFCYEIGETKPCRGTIDWP